MHLIYAVDLNAFCRWMALMENFVNSFNVYILPLLVNFFVLINVLTVTSLFKKKTHENVLKNNL